MSLRFLSQNMAHEEPEKKMPLVAANAIKHLAKLALVGLHHLRAQWALRCTHGIVSIACSRCNFSFGSLMYMLMSVDVLNCNLEAIKASCFGDHDFSGKVDAQIFIGHSVRGSKECEDVRDEVTFGVGQSDPVCEVC